jgi:O-antigen ligase
VLVELGLLPVCALILWTSGRLKRSLKIVMVAGLVLMVAVGWQLGGTALTKRFQTIGDDKMSGREEIYENGERMVSDFALFGSGAETFPKVYFLYRADPSQKWEAYAHDDYLETRITFGWVGLSLVLAALILVPLCTQFSAGIPAGRTFLLFLLTSLGGLMLHARFDPSFQNYSVHFTFLILCAVMSCLSVPRR